MQTPTQKGVTNSVTATINSIQPVTFRLPKSGQKDPYFGFSRSSYYELEAAGALQLKRVRKRGNVRGMTLVPFDQVYAYIFGLTA